METLNPEQLLRQASRHHFGPEQRDQLVLSDGYCTIYALSVAASYLTTIPSKEVAQRLHEVILNTPIEETPLAEGFSNGLPPIINTDDGGDDLGVWLTSKYRHQAVNYINNLLVNAVGVAVSADMNRNQHKDVIKFANRRFTEVVKKGLPVIASMRVYDQANTLIDGHSVLLSPLSNQWDVVIHDSNLSQPLVKSWHDFKTALWEGRRYEVYGKKYLSFDPLNPWLKVHRV